MRALGAKSFLYVIAVGRGRVVSDYVFGRDPELVEWAAHKRSRERRMEMGAQPGPMPLIKYGHMVRMHVQDIPTEVLPLPDSMSCLQEGGTVIASMVSPMSGWQTSCQAPQQQAAE